MLVLCGAAPRAAQAPSPTAGGATFRILHQGAQVGVMTAAVARDADGWTLLGSSYVGGKYLLTVRRFEAHYDAEWRARFATMELSTPTETVVAHTALNGPRTRTDVVQAGKQATWGESVTSADTIVIPDMVFSSYEALAARLTGARPGTELPVFVLPLSEIRLRLDSVADEPVSTTSGRVTAQHWKAAFLTNTRESPVEIWVAAGRLVRVEMVRDEISVIRTDITP